MEKLIPIEDNKPPSGWLGDVNEWPILFFRNHVREWNLCAKEDWESGWLGRTVHHTVYCYVCLEDAGWEDLSFVLLSALPDIGRDEDKMTWLEFESQMNDPATFWEMVLEALGGDRGSWMDRKLTPAVDWAMAEGVCPGQWLVLKLTPNYITYPATVDGPEEYDFEIEAELIDRERLSPQEHLQRWEEFLYETDLEDGRPRYFPPLKELCGC